MRFSPRLPLHAALALAAGSMTPSLRAQAEAASGPVQRLAPFVVHGSRPSAADTAGPNAIDSYDPDFIDGTGAFTIDEFLQTLPPAQLGATRLVLVDGVPTKLDPSSLPLDMIERVEVARNGSMPAHGAYSSGGVVNIVLKKDYTGGNVQTRDRESFAGGAGNHNVALSAGYKKGPWRLTASLTASQQRPLFAADRELSRNQDHTAWGGEDLRLPWGSLATVVSDTPLNGLSSPTAPVFTAMVPAGQAPSAPADFIAGPVGATSGSGLQHFNTADYLLLSGPSQQQGLGLTLHYQATPQLAVSAGYSYSHSESQGIQAPPVTAASPATLIPAALNPFGQDVEIGLVHTAFGPVTSVSESDRHQLTLGTNGTLHETWHWQGQLAVSESTSRQTATDLDPAKFSAALVAEDPAARFNPFGDPALIPADLDLYRELTLVRESANDSQGTQLNAGLSGPVGHTWGGPMNVSLGTDYQWDRSHRTAFNAAGTVPADLRDSREQYGLFGNLSAPLINPARNQPGLRRADLEVGLRYSAQDAGSSSAQSSLGLSWSPHRALLFRVSHSQVEQFVALRQIDEPESLTTVTLLDPRRQPSSTSDITISSGPPPDATRATSASNSLGLVFEPTQLKGLKFQIDYSSSAQHDLVRRLSAQDIVYNEAALPTRIARAEPSASDTALSQPGPLLAVDTTPLRTGDLSNRRCDFSLEYQAPASFGRMRLSAQASHTLDSVYDLLPGVPYQHADAESRPPDWSYSGQAQLTLGAWNLSSHLAYTAGGSLAGDPYDSYTTVDFRAGYRFTAPLLGERGRGVRVGIGFANAFDAKPPRADTLVGYTGGSALGRTAELTLSVPL